MRVKIHFSKGFFPLLFSSFLTVLFLTGCAEDSRILDNGQNRQLEFSVSTHGWDNSNKSSNQKVTSRASPISTFDTSKNFNVIADINKGDNWSTEVNNETVSYSTTNKIWQTTATHYWPRVGSTVNFYAYYPTSILNNITHTTGSAPVFSYTVPDNAADQIDILTSSKTSIAGNSYSQTSVDFKHIFAAIQFNVGSSGLPNGTITQVTLNNIQYKGTYSLDGTWIPNITDTKSFSQTVSVSTNASTPITSGATTFMMMPQTLSNDASITVTYNNGGTLTKTITGTWEAGKTYIYNLSKIIPVTTFSYTGDVQSYTVPLTGTYKLEVWGAEGGYNTTSTNGGRGGYSYGNIKLNNNRVLFVYVGGSGNSGNGYNGGGLGQAIGGGATHIAITSGLLNTMSLNTNNILIIAGGGGGATDGYIGGSGGGTSGSDGVGVHPKASTTGKGGSQTSGGSGGTSINYGIASSGGFGYGGSGVTSNESGPGGGGGWYGGGGTPVGGGAGGGSGYLGSSLISGTTGMQNDVRSGNGYVRITFVSAN
jgi:hypothetical protein